MPRLAFSADTPRVSLTESEQLHQLELLRWVSQLLAQSDNLDDMFRDLMELTTQELTCERSSFFLHDDETDELYTRFAQGYLQREIRIMSDTGVAGEVFTSGESAIIKDVTKDEHFNRSVDEETGFITRSILCVPIKTVKGEIIGVVQALNKLDDEFDQRDLDLLEAITTQAALSLQSVQSLERMQKSREMELEFLNLVSDLTSELELAPLLQRAMEEATRMLKADRSTLFINDDSTGELYSRVSQGLDTIELRLPNTAGIAGAVFTSGKTINIPYAYADLRFNPAFDKQTGYFTRSILCVPVLNKKGKTIGVTQALNKHGGPFSEEDESRLRAFTAQISNGLENAKLFDDIQRVKNYNQSMLESMSNGVMTLDEKGVVVTCNGAGLNILKASAEEMIGQPIEQLWEETNPKLTSRIMELLESRETELLLDTEITLKDEPVSINLTIQPLESGDDKSLGMMLMIEDISSEKRIKSTMSRYMDPLVADQLLGQGDDVLGGQSVEATILFSDIRSFTTLSEQTGAQGTVSLLNEYFSLMVECIQDEGGMLDKFIGDALMAAFGLPISHGDDEDRAVRSAIQMMARLADFNQHRAERDLLPIDIGIGINTDLVVSGNIGSPRRMDYTVIGDGVNLASRLESACKQYFSQLLIAQNTYDKLHGTYRIRKVDRVIVKGKTEPVNIYEVLDFHTEQSFPNLMDVVGNFNEGVERYQSGGWQKAAIKFRDVLQLHPGDQLSQLYIERCQYLDANPPQGDWNGVWVMESK